MSLLCRLLLTEFFIDSPWHASYVNILPSELLKGIAMAGAMRKA